MYLAIRILGSILSLFFLFSFHKHPDPGPDCTRLYKVYMWHSSHPDRNIDIYEYYYDSLNRVTEIKQYLLDSIDGSLQYKFIKTMQCFYNGSEQLPYKTKGFHYFAEKVIWYFYDSSGRMITDSMSGAGENNAYAIHKYRWNNDIIIENERSPSVIQQTSTVISNHNVASITVLKHVASHLGLTHVEFNYDNKVNPMNKLNIGPIMTISWPYATTDQRTSGYNKNNITEWTLGSLRHNNVFTPKHNWTCTYKYNNAGLLVECEISGLSYSRAKDRIQYCYTD
jgi:hypothetical protein